MTQSKCESSSLPSPPLTGLVVLELGTIIAGPFCGSLLAEQGATVIKIEAPAGDGLRRMGPTLGPDSVWWGVSSRNKRCISLDLKNEAGRQILQHLVTRADVLTENYRPGVLDKLGFPPRVLNELNPRLITLRISGYGQDGPWAHRPGFGKIAEGLSGVPAVTGRKDGRPLFMGFSLADTAAGLFGSLGVVAALLGQRGQATTVDLGLYEPLLRILEPRLNMPGSTRSGTNNPLGWGGDCSIRSVFLHTSDDKWLQVEQDMDSPMLEDQSWCEVADQASNWLETKLSSASAIAELKRSKFSYYEVLDAQQILESEYYRRREDVLPHRVDDTATLHVPGFVPKAYCRQGARPYNSPAIGEDNNWMAKEFLQMNDSQVRSLVEQGAFG